jgi:hypothetical protein
VSGGVVEVQQLILGPEYKDFAGVEPSGECSECGGQCAPRCGVHPKGCIWGGPTRATAYWLYDETCELYHGVAK